VFVVVTATKCVSDMGWGQFNSGIGIEAPELELII